MTKYTQDQLLAMTKEQLDEIVGGLQWERLKGDWKSIIFDDPESGGLICNYHPSTNKAPAWDLMVKCLDSGLMKNTLLKLTNYSDELTIAVTIAAILHLQESE